MFLVVLMYSVSLWSTTREGFTADIVLEDIDIYDSEYAKIYKALWHSSKDLLDFEQVSIQEILADQAIADVNVVDLACGIAQHSCFLKNLNVKYTGVDLSQDMLAEARQKCPTDYKRADIKDSGIFAPKTFSHALLLGFSIYQFPNPKVITDNAYMWLKPEGTLIMHLVEPDRFDPLLELASPFAAFSLQKYSTERQTKSEIYFDEFKYFEVEYLFGYNNINKIIAYPSSALVFADYSKQLILAPKNRDLFRRHMTDQLVFFQYSGLEYKRI
jgi:SAM-dependent methyltransferase